MDKEAAWALMKTLFEQGNREAAYNMGAMWSGVAAVEGKGAALRWLIARLDEIPESARTDTVKNPIRQNTMLPEDYRSLMQTLPRPQDRLDFASSIFAVGDVNEVRAALDQ